MTPTITTALPRMPEDSLACKRYKFNGHEKQFQLLEVLSLFLLLATSSVLAARANAKPAGAPSQIIIRTSSKISGPLDGNWQIARDGSCLGKRRFASTADRSSLDMVVCSLSYYDPRQARKRGGIVSLFILERKTLGDGGVYSDMLDAGHPLGKRIRNARQGEKYPGVKGGYSLWWEQYNCITDELRGKLLALTNVYDETRLANGAALFLDPGITLLRPNQSLVLIEGQRYWQLTNFNNPKNGVIPQQEDREFGEWMTVRPGTNGAAGLDWFCKAIR